jgi:hypothetical protein
MQPPPTGVRLRAKKGRPVAAAIDAAIASQSATY